MMFGKRLLAVLLVLLTSLPIILPFSTVLLAEGKKGTSLEAYVTASAINLTRYTWSITKNANVSEVYLSRNNPVAIVEYTVSVVKALESVLYYIEGYVCVNNTGNVITENLKIELDVYVGPGWNTMIISDYPVNVSEKPVLGPGEMHCYWYRIDIPQSYWGYDKFKVTANVTITNHSGRLGTPFGPSPSNTTTRTYKVDYDCINVTDTAGYSWRTCDSSSWNYNVMFEYKPEMGEFYEYVNTATIVETGLSASWTLKVYQEIVKYATISGIVFWDNNHNGKYDGGDKPIVGAAVYLYKYNADSGVWIYVGTVYTNESGYYYFEVEPGYLYKVEVETPAYGPCDMIVRTTPSYYEIAVEEPNIYSGYNFGFVCLKKLTGAFSKGYWSWCQCDKRTGQCQTRVTQDDVSYINAELGTNFGSRKELAEYLTSPVYGNMTTALMQQLIATLLNLKYGYISGSTVVYYEGKYFTISKVVSNAKIALREGTRTIQEYWKNILDAINNNNVYYVYLVNY